MMDKEKEEVYINITKLATLLSQYSQKMNCEQLLCVINCFYKGNNPYAGIRNVLKAAHNRANDKEKTALENVFIDKIGDPLNWRF